MNDTDRLFLAFVFSTVGWVVILCILNRWKGLHPKIRQYLDTILVVSILIIIMMFLFLLWGMSFIIA